MLFNMAGGGNTKFDLLWENASPSSSFGAQDVTIDGLSLYAFIAVKTEIGIFFISTNVTSTQSMSAVSKIDEDDFIQVTRRVSISENTISFRDGYGAEFVYANATYKNNDSVIPHAIYGVHKKE